MLYGKEEGALSSCTWVRIQMPSSDEKIHLERHWLQICFQGHTLLSTWSCVLNTEVKDNTQNMGGILATRRKDKSFNGERVFETETRMFRAVFSVMVKYLNYVAFWLLCSVVKSPMRF